MRVPNLDPPDDALDAFGPESTARPDKLSIVDLSKWSGDGDPLDAFAAEPTERATPPPPPVEPIELPRHLERIEPAQVERTEPAARLELERAEPPRTIRTTRTPRTIRTTRTIRTIRTIRTTRTIRTVQTAAGLAALAVLAFTTITALNEIRYRMAQPPDAPVVARAPNQDLPAPPATRRPDPSAPVAGMSLADAMATKAPDAVAAAPAPAVAPTTQEATSAVRAARNVAPPLPAKEPARAPERRPAVDPPSRPPVAQSVTPRVVDLAPPAAAKPAATTGVAAPPASLPSTSPPSTTQLPAATPVVAPADPPPPANPLATARTPAAAGSSPAVVSAPTPPPAVAVTPAPAAAPPAPASRVVSERAAVESVLGRYASAFSSLDAGRAKAVWPGVNQRNLERAFDTLEQQEFDLGACEITVLPPQATALCDGTARYTPKVGNRRMRTESRRWTFRLRQNGQNWAIESVETR